MAMSMLSQDYDLAVEIVACRRLVKGYSDTHSRGQSKFDRVLSAVPMLTARPDSAAWLRRLRQAALLDEEGIALDGALKTVASIYG
jgi:indolepyruvate ferredoxin oxidoreductase beta subunit